MKVVQSKIRSELPNGVRASPGFFEALDKKISELVKESVRRMEFNKRKTLKEYDL